MNLNIKKNIMKIIEFENNLLATYNDEFHDDVIKHSWKCYYNKRAKKYYPVTILNKKLISLSNFILPKTNEKIIFYLDGNPLNCQLDNLKYITKSEFQATLPPKEGKYKGVYLTKNNHFRAKITILGKEKHLGCFLTDKEAAISYNEKAKQIYGDLAYLNKID